jgi:hypothetical protein
MDRQWSWRRSLRNLGLQPIPAGVVTVMAWGGNRIVLEGNRQRLKTDKECIMLGGDEGKRWIKET